MPLTARGRRIAGSFSAAGALAPGVLGCEIVHRQELCVSCGRCVAACPAGALTQETWFDPQLLLRAPVGSRRGALGEALRRIARREPSGLIPVPERVRTFRDVTFAPQRCLGCGACVRACPTGALLARPVPLSAVAPQAAPADGGRLRPSGAELGVGP